MRKARISLVIWHRVLGKKVLITEARRLREGDTSEVGMLLMPTTTVESLLSFDEVPSRSFGSDKDSEYLFL